MNKQYFQDIVKGEYGRQVATTDVEVITKDNVVDVLNATVHVLTANYAAANYLWNYKKGDQPVLYRTNTIREDVNNPVCENHAWEFTQFGVTQTYGEPIQYVRRKKSDAETDDKKDKAVDALNDIMQSAFKFVRNATQGEWKIATGTSYLALRRTKIKNKPISIAVPTPLNTYIVYSSVTDEPLLSVQRLKDTNNEEYYHCYSNNMEFKIKAGTLISYNLHAFGGIPIVEIPNNIDRLSDIELVISMLDAINNMQSNRMDAVQQFVQFLMVFTNCEIDSEQYQEMKKTGAITVKSNNSDQKPAVDILAQELNQSESQVAKDDLLANAESILAIPSKQGGTGGDTQGAVELRNGWDFSKGRAKIKDAYVKEGELRFAELALNALRIDEINLGLSINDIDVQISHSPTDNLQVKAQSLQMLLTAGIHPLVAIKTCGLWSDVEKVFLMSKDYLDAKYKTIQNVEEEEQKAQALLASQSGDTE